MTTVGSRRTRRRVRGPAPAQAPSSLAVHDIKNLAGRLAALSRNLDESYQDPLFKPTVIDILDDTVEHLKRLAGDLRDHAGRVTIKLRVDLNEVLHDALMDARPDLAARVHVLEDYSEIPRIWADSFLLRRAFACTMENALEAMGGRGTLSVSTELVRRNGHRRIRVEIEDDGPGMDGEFIRERLFCPFSSTKENGLGLGVYTMAQVARLHGGTVRIASAPDVGTRVRFHFPVEEG
jgi:signal transduction histidine kinase